MRRFWVAAALHVPCRFARHALAGHSMEPAGTRRCHPRGDLVWLAVPSSRVPSGSPPERQHGHAHIARIPGRLLLSVWALFSGEHIFFETAGAIVTLITLGRALERAKASSRPYTVSSSRARRRRR